MNHGQTYAFLLNVNPHFFFPSLETQHQREWLSSSSGLPFDAVLLLWRCLNCGQPVAKINKSSPASISTAFQEGKSGLNGSTIWPAGAVEWINAWNIAAFGYASRLLLTKLFWVARYICDMTPFAAAALARPSLQHEMASSWDFCTSFF